MESEVTFINELLDGDASIDDGLMLRRDMWRTHARIFKSERAWINKLFVIMSSFHILINLFAPARYVGVAQGIIRAYW